MISISREGLSTRIYGSCNRATTCKSIFSGPIPAVTATNWFSGGSNQFQEITAGSLKIDNQVSQLVQAMATYSANNPGFDPTSPSISAVPNDTSLQNTVAAAWHA
jgi:hypothetical protein